ncbi:M23 family metallopeptidase [Neobacillus mesonae]|uniref:M23 family metallopeptidase n=1 Tax=Neobacillus mesonae TaxID=1193713 RepID=UPI00203DCF3C|nr:M23 family metallopeptidase [Neobacillus mesonae]MCM3567578.1 M23 family metallopeptidase [Neobacillus mesonae]
MRAALFIGAFLFCFNTAFTVQAKEPGANPYQERMLLYKKVETVTQVPWYYLAAIDQYERNMRSVRRDLPKPNGVLGIYFPKEVWAGPANPNLLEENPAIIQFFNGIGVDGNGDGKASLNQDEDVLYAMANYLTAYGVDHDNIKIGLWNYYKRDRTVGSIATYAKLYRHFGRLDLDKRVFPVPLHSNHSYRSTWGDRRGWGGRRIHEGTDIFAGYGVPVRATCYGVVEIKGWNKYGGWRIGIRDINNTYHYFAHLSGFAKDIHVGQIVEPGTVIGGVGSTGYGPPGTSGKFPPHLHYGMYKDNGRLEWSFDPYPHLARWKQLERMEMRKKK